MVNASETSPMTSMTTPIERKSPIREFLPMQKNILSIIFCRSPMSVMEPWEPENFLERLLDPLRPALWKNNHRFIYYLFFQSTLTRGFISILWESESFGWSPTWSSLLSAICKLRHIKTIIMTNPSGFCLLHCLLNGASGLLCLLFNTTCVQYISRNLPGNPYSIKTLSPTLTYIYTHISDKDL